MLSNVKLKIFTSLRTIITANFKGCLAKQIETKCILKKSKYKNFGPNQPTLKQIFGELNLGSIQSNLRKI